MQLILKQTEVNQNEWYLKHNRWQIKKNIYNNTHVKLDLTVNNF